MVKIAAKEKPLCRIGQNVGLARCLPEITPGEGRFRMPQLFCYPPRFLIAGAAGSIVGVSTQKAIGSFTKPYSGARQGT